VIDGIDILEGRGSHLVLVDEAGQSSSHIRDITVETVGPLRVTLGEVQAMPCCFGPFCCPPQLLCQKQPGGDAGPCNRPARHPGGPNLETKAQFISDLDARADTSITCAMRCLDSIVSAHSNRWEPI
jgi:hypothetical protein